MTSSGRRCLTPRPATLTMCLPGPTCGGTMQARTAAVILAATALTLTACASTSRPDTPLLSADVIALVDSGSCTSLTDNLDRARTQKAENRPLPPTVGRAVRGPHPLEGQAARLHLDLTPGGAP